jgi:hypothetical protein
MHVYSTVLLLYYAVAETGFLCEKTVVVVVSMPRVSPISIAAFTVRVSVCVYLGFDSEYYEQTSQTTSETVQKF